MGVLDEIKAISAPSWDWAWAWAELGNYCVIVLWDILSVYQGGFDELLWVFQGSFSLKGALIVSIMFQEIFKIVVRIFYRGF